MGCGRDCVSAVRSDESALVRNVRSANIRVAFACTELIGLSSVS